MAMGCLGCSGSTGLIMARQKEKISF